MRQLPHSSLLAFVPKWMVVWRLILVCLLLPVFGSLLELLSFVLPWVHRPGWRWICGNVVRAMGVRLEVRGVCASGAGILFAANHTSFLDIPILWSLLPASFVSKAEVRSWPFIGWFAQRGRALFVSRKGVRAGAELVVFQEALRNRNLILFPEGTSSDGTYVYPFKSTFFQFSQDIAVRVQPISLVYHELCGRPMGHFFRKFYGWYGDTTLLGGVLQMLFLGTATVVVVFHPLLNSHDFSGRKTLALAARKAVVEGMHELREGLISTNN